jgi:lipoprotein-releasing system permease protein
MIKRWMLTWSFASRYSRAAYNNRYIRFINRASMFGIALGVAAMILGLSVMNGFERELKNNLLSVIPDIEFEAVNGEIADWRIASQEIAKQPYVKGVAPYINVNGMVQKGDKLEAAFVRGADQTEELNVNVVADFIFKGSWNLDSGVVIGNGLAEKLSLQVGDSIELLVPKHTDRNSLGAPEYIKTQVNGIYKIGGQFDYGQVFIDINVLQKLFDWQKRQVKGVKVAIVDPFQADWQARKLGSLIDEYVYVLDWYRSHGHIYRDIVMVRDIMYLVMIIVMAVACFNLVSSLTMAIQEKHADIGILKTMGLLPTRVKSVFVLMGLIIASKGIAVGAIFGCGLSLFLPYGLTFLERKFNFSVLDDQVYFIDTIPTQLDFSQVLIVVVTASFIAYLASVFPARKAAKLNVVELLN